MIKREKKNTLIWMMFGIYLGTSIARAVQNVSETGIWDWLLIVVGLIVAVIHYSPDKQNEK